MRTMFQLMLLLGFYTFCLARQYHYVNDPKTWAEAQIYCRVHYSDFASIDNSEEALEIVKLLDIRNSNLTWIGLYNDLDSWRWSLDDSSSYYKNERNFRNWYIEKPKNWGGSSLCASFSCEDGAWHEAYCFSTFRFVCYDGSVNATEPYVIMNSYMNWTGAQGYCREHHTDLAIVRNKTENLQLRSLCGDHYFDAVWIGLYRTRFWSDNSNSSFSYWKTGQPDNAGQRESCTAVSFDEAGMWTDEHCGQALPFICYTYMSPEFSHYYHFINETKSWAEAQRYCRENYIDLATIDNMGDMNSVINTVNGRYYGLAWIGLYDDLDSWRWSLDDDSFYNDGEKDFRGWPHQPDNWNGNEMCASVKSDGMWFDQNCLTSLTFVCYDGQNGKDDYIWISLNLSWADAQFYCRMHYTDLAIVRNHMENIRVLNNTRSFPFWIGLYRTRLWSDQHSLAYENWKPAIPYSPPQPDNGIYVIGEYGNQHCTAVSFRDSGKWTDENCLARFPFVCYASYCTVSSCWSHQYYFISEDKSWTEAQSYCRKYYTDLATIDNMEDMNNLLNTAKGSYIGLAWIGLYDDLTSWKWSLEDDAFYQDIKRSFNNWYRYIPGNWGGNSLCTYISSFDGRWQEHPCSSRLLFFCYDEKQDVSQSYTLVHKFMTWTEAQRYCREHHTDLAIVRNETENLKLRSQFNNTNYNYGPAWIGLYRTRSWSDNSSSSFSYWKAGQPDNAAESEHCTAVSFNDSGQWTDEHCGQLLPFFCYNSSSQYQFINESKGWTEAQRYCRENYTDLVTINNMEDMSSLINTVNGSYIGLAWIGLYDDLDNWRWSLENDTFYNNGGWPHQPDNYNGQELCVSMSPSGEWFDNRCTDRVGFVCYNGVSPVACEDALDLCVYHHYHILSSPLEKNDTHFVWISEGKTWVEAQSFCREFYTDLASVRNNTEQQQIMRISNGTIWIGLYRTRLWSDHSRSNFTYWRSEIFPVSGEPNNGLGITGQLGCQHCTAVDHSGYWKDENCLASFPFICYNAPKQSGLDWLIGLRVKVRSMRNLSESEIKEMVLMQLQNELSRLGLPSNLSINVKNVRKISP